MKTLLTSLKMFLMMTLITGVIYPVIIWGYSNLFIQEKASGSLLRQDSRIIGSELIGQKFSKPNYFWSRPSACDYNPMPSGASNLGPTSLVLKKQVEDRVDLLTKSGSNIIPQDLIFASASGLDPHISLESAEYQLARVSQNRGVNVTTLRKLLQELTEGPQYGIFGETRVNVLKLNLAIEKLATEN